jgi:hypothetical protein
VVAPWRGWFSAIFVTLAGGALIILDVTDGALRRWWSAHALTTDVVSGLLGLLTQVAIRGEDPS